MSDNEQNASKYKIIVFNTCTGTYEETEVSEEVAKEFKRGCWRIKKNNLKHRINESMFSDLIGSDDDSLDSFDEFVSLDQRIGKLEFLIDLKEILNKEEYKLMISLFIMGYTEREYGEEIGMSKSSVHRLKKKVIEKIKKYYQKADQN